MSDLAYRQACAGRGRIYTCVVAAVSLLRGFEVVVRVRPETPLRMLCAVTFDTLYKLRTSRRLPIQRIKTLLTLLELGACINRHFDSKGFDPCIYRGMRERLKQAGVNQLVLQYVKQLKAIERTRPRVNGDERRHHAVKIYREDVVRLSLAMATALVFEARSLDEGLEAMMENEDFEIIFRIVMQCQVIDDLLDESKDKAGGLPSFLTAAASREVSLEMTKKSISGYRGNEAFSPPKGVLPFRMALEAASCIAWLVLATKRGILSVR